jgi:hypothetical protein
MDTRPVTLALAAVLLAVIGAGVGFVGAFLLAIAAGAIPLLDSSGGLLAPVGLLGMAAVVAAVLVLVASTALWLRRAWAWAVSLAIAVAGVIGAVIAISTAGSQVPNLIGLVMTVGATALLVAPSTRAAVRIG